MIRDRGPRALDEPGRTALRPPEGDPGLLRRSAERLDRVAMLAGRTATVRGSLEPLLRTIWTGAAADLATSEATTLAARSDRVVGVLPRAGAALRRYAAAIERARALTRRLQAAWDADRDEHRRVRHLLLTRQAGTGIDQGEPLARLAERHRAGQARLARRHTDCLESVRAAGAAAAATLAELGRLTVPDGREPSAAVVRSRLTADLGFAAGAARATAAREDARRAAEQWRRVAAGSDPAAGDVARLVRRLAGAARDPLFAQAFLDEVGVAGLTALLAAVGRPGSATCLEQLRELAGVLGTLVLTAANPALSGLDPRTARQLAAGAALLGDELVRSVGAVVTSGGQRDSGYWLLGQLLVGARASGYAARLPDGLVRRLVGATAAAEIDRSRDGRFARRHGTTRSPDGDAQFASFFPDAEHTGDALHVLLEQVSDDPDEQSAVLGLEIPRQGLRNDRGDPLILAEYLVRRWVTHTVATPDSPTDLHLATNADLVALLASAASGGAPVAALRARVMIEVGRTNDLAQREWSTILRYESNTGPTESAAVDWLGQMRSSVAATLQDGAGRPAPGAGADGYAFSPTRGATTASDPGAQPLLHNRELARLVGAFALGTNFAVGGKAPATDYQRLLRAELDRLGERIAAGTATYDDVLRIGFYDGSASAGLASLAAHQDALNQRMWRLLFEVKNLAWVKDSRNHAVDLATSGTTRTELDDLVISLLRSDTVSSQAEANDARTAALLASVRATMAGLSGPQPAATGLAAGHALAPDSPTGPEARLARAREIRERVTALWDAQSEDRHRGRETTPDGAGRLRSGA